MRTAFTILNMYMHARRPDRPPCVAHPAHGLPCRQFLPRRHTVPVKMGKPSLDTISIVHDDDITVTVHPPGVLNRSRLRRTDRGTPRTRHVHRRCAAQRMFIRHASNRVLPVHHAIHPSSVCWRRFHVSTGGVAAASTTCTAIRRRRRRRLDSQGLRHQRGVRSGGTGERVSRLPAPRAPHSRRVVDSCQGQRSSGHDKLTTFAYIQSTRKTVQTVASMAQ